MKQDSAIDIRGDVFVASFTDAWIETTDVRAALDALAVASFTDAWIETSNLLAIRDARHVASFTDAWIETSGSST